MNARPTIGDAVLLDDDQIVRRNPRVVHRDLSEDGGSVLLHLDSASYHGLNRVGTLIWTLIDGGRTFKALITALRERIEDAPPDLEQDISEFLVNLEQRDLVIFDTSGVRDAERG